MRHSGQQSLRRKQHPQEELQPAQPDQHRSCRVLLKVGVVATYDLEVQCQPGMDLFRSFQVDVEKTTLISTSRQRFFIANGTKSLSTVAQLNSALDALYAGTARGVLTVQLLSDDPLDVQRQEQHPQEELQPAQPGQHRSCRILLKAGDGATYDLEVQCQPGMNLFRSFQSEVEKEAQIPPSKQCFFTANGTKRLFTLAQLNSALEASLEAGDVLIVQLLSKTDHFVSCEQHPSHERMAFCVLCRKILCYKCLFTHGNPPSLHPLADLEDHVQFTATVGVVLQQCDQALMNAMRSAQSNKTTRLQCFSQLLDQAVVRRQQWCDALLTSSEFALFKQRRRELGTTGETANWLRGRKPQSVQLQHFARYRCSTLRGQVNPMPKLALVASSSFQACSTHQSQTECLYCVQCVKTMCPKCFALHGNQNHGHQCADMEDPQQFSLAVKDEIEKLDAEMQNVEETVTQSEQQPLQSLAISLQHLGLYWADYVNALKLEFDAETNLIKRNLATTPLEIAQWLCSQQAPAGASPQALPDYGYGTYD